MAVVGSRLVVGGGQLPAAGMGGHTPSTSLNNMRQVVLTPLQVLLPLSLFLTHLLNVALTNSLTVSPILCNICSVEGSQGSYRPTMDQGTHRPPIDWKTATIMIYPLSLGSVMFRPVCCIERPGWGIVDC